MRIQSVFQLLVVLGALVLSVVGQSSRQPSVPGEKICLDSSCFQLEMAQAAAVSELAEKYDVEKTGDDKAGATYLFTDKVEKTRVVANFGFRGGKLKYISKYWNPPEDTAASMLHVIYSLSAQFSDTMHGVCILQTKASDLPSLETKTVFLTCGARYVRLDFIRYQGRESVSVQEIIQSKDWAQ